MTLTGLTRWPLAVLRYSEAYGDAEVRAFLADMAALLGRGEPFALAIVTHPAQFRRSLSPEVSRAYALGVEANREAMAARCRGLAFVVADESAREAYAAKVQGNGQKAFGTPMRVFAAEVEACAWLVGNTSRVHTLGRNLMNHQMKCLLLLAVFLISSATSAQKTTPSTFPVTVQHNRGEHTFERPPERVVAVSEEIVELVLALGTRPVGFASSRLSDGTLGGPVTHSSYYDTVALGQPTFVGTSQAPSAEAVLSLQPDLIITYDSVTDAQAYKALSRVAPTLSYNVRAEGAWQDALLEVGKALGRSQRAQEVIETLEAERQRLREQLAQIVTRAPSVSILYLPNPQNIYVFDGTYALAAPLEDLGFTVHIPRGVELENGLGQLSTEVLPTLEADTIITLRLSGNDGQPTPHPADSLLELGSAKVTTHVLEPERPATGPLTDLAYLEAFAALLKEAHAEEAP